MVKKDYPHERDNVRESSDTRTKRKNAGESRREKS